MVMATTSVLTGKEKKITATSPYFIEVLLDLRITVVVRHSEMFINYPTNQDLVTAPC